MSFEQPATSPAPRSRGGSSSVPVDQQQKAQHQTSKSSSGALAVKRTNEEMQRTVSRDTAGLEAILDYAIAEGAQLRLPLFVSLLRLARMALKEETEAPRNRKSDARS